MAFALLRYRVSSNGVFLTVHMLKDSGIGSLLVFDLADDSHDVEKSMSSLAHSTLGM